MYVRWGDMDTFGHVNNIIYFQYFETGRIKYLEEICTVMNNFDMLQSIGVGPILKYTDCRFRRAIEYPDEVMIGVNVTDVSDTELVQEYAVISKKNWRSSC